jgi:hypothetical protein
MNASDKRQPLKAAIWAQHSEEKNVTEDDVIVETTLEKEQHAHVGMTARSVWNFSKLGLTVPAGLPQQKTHKRKQNLFSTRKIFLLKFFFIF